MTVLLFSNLEQLDPLGILPYSFISSTSREFLLLQVALKQVKTENK